MNNKTIISLLSILLVFNIAGALIIWVQNGKIKELQNNFSLASNLKTEQPQTKVLMDDENKEIKETENQKQFEKLIDQENFITGIVESISDETITIKTLMKQFDELKGVDLNQSYQVNLKEAEYVVAIDQQTQFDGVKKADLKVGDKIKAENDSTIYGKENFTAKKITYLKVEEPEKNGENK